MRKIQKQKYFATLLSMFAIAFILTVSAAMAAVTLQPILSGLSSPVFVTNAGDGTRRLFIVEQAGIIKVFQPVGNTTSNFLDIRTRVLSGGERGLLGLAFHPQYATNGRFFVYYTRQTDGAIQIAEYQRSSGDANVADTNEKIIITIPHPGQANHNGGTIAFGADGFLYAGTGDGGSGNDIADNGKTANNAQNTNELLGKFIRINIDVPASPTVLYTSPSDNPFVGVNGADEIYAFGVRNPYRWSFDRGGTRQLWAGDVGQSLFEEVDIITKGGNFGWRIMEGNQCNPNFNGGACTPPAGHIPPIFQYSNANSSRCAITGGYVYRGTRQIFTSGAYIYGDYCTGEILIWENNTQTLLLDTTRLISSFGEDEDGEIYVVGIGSSTAATGTIEKIIPLGTTAASVSISGRVTAATGRAISNVVIRLTDSSGNIRMAITTKKGYYNFADVAAGDTYIITAKGKHYSFSQPSQVLNIDDDASDVNFVANP